jgi:sugar fermentation stimulation protein A
MIHFNESMIYGSLVKRYQRFFMDVQLDNGIIVTAHTPNTGSMLGLLQPNNRVMLSKSADPKRRLAFTTQAIAVDDSWVGVNTHLPNKLVRASVSDPLFAELHSYQSVKAEVRYGSELRSRVDLYFYDHPQETPLYLEIKNVTLKMGDYALFPDAVSVRAHKHMHDLMSMKDQGFNASLFFIIQRTDCQFFAPARSIDPVYANLLRLAQTRGVSIRAFSASIDETGVRISQEIPCEF